MAEDGTNAAKPKLKVGKDEAEAAYKAAEKGAKKVVKKGAVEVGKRMGGESGGAVGGVLGLVATTVTGKTAKELPKAAVGAVAGTATGKGVDYAVKYVVTYTTKKAATAGAAEAGKAAMRVGAAKGAAAAASGGFASMAGELAGGFVGKKVGKKLAKRMKPNDKDAKARAGRIGEDLGAVSGAAACGAAAGGLIAGPVGAAGGAAFGIGGWGLGKAVGLGVDAASDFHGVAAPKTKLVIGKSTCSQDEAAACVVTEESAGFGACVIYFYPTEEEAKAIFDKWWSSRVLFSMTEGRLVKDVERGGFPWHQANINASVKELWAVFVDRPASIYAWTQAGIDDAKRQGVFEFLGEPKVGAFLTDEQLEGFALGATSADKLASEFGYLTAANCTWTAVGIAEATEQNVLDFLGNPQIGDEFTASQLYKFDGIGMKLLQIIEQGFIHVEGPASSPALFGCIVGK